MTPRKPTGKPAKATRKPTPGQLAENAALRAELAEAREQQAATAEILGVISASPADARPVFEVIARSVARLCNEAFGAVVVLDGDELAGILTERDYARKVVLAGRSSKDAAVRAIMTADVVCVQGTRSIEDCMALMTARRVRHLPVIEGGRVVGLVSIGDLVKATIDEQEFTISQLKNYIAG